MNKVALNLICLLSNTQSVLKADISLTSISAAVYLIGKGNFSSVYLYRLNKITCVMVNPGLIHNIGNLLIGFILSLILTTSLICYKGIVSVLSMFIGISNKCKNLKRFSFLFIQWV